MKKHPYVAVMEALKESLNGEAMRLFKMKVDSIKKQEEKAKLKPCPFCGGEVRMHRDELDYGRFAQFTVVHVKDEDQETCIRVSYQSAEEAIRHWNKRDTDA